jgi:hypothetical protein
MQLQNENSTDSVSSKIQLLKKKHGPSSTFQAKAKKKVQYFANKLLT